MVRGGKGDFVSGLDGAAAVNEFGVDGAGLGVADGQGEARTGFAVVGGEGVVSDEEAVADADALCGEDSSESGDGACMGLGLSELVGFARVNGEEE
jgi:hypothetical protein